MLVWVIVVLLLAAGLVTLAHARTSRGTGPQRHVPPEYAEPGRCVVVLGSPGPRPAETLATVRETTGVGLRQARDWLAAAPCAIAGGLSRESADRLRERLERTGASAWVRDS
ncbi:ribosomal protein L7/L12 [Nocardioides marmoribigeumensis]|uniref:Ribosomal protein L7/L12 n=1 Tax=Nocardioides marmoribigeumensis TaxID=433649 RepID=A0ABU2BSG7_9ACTN|nr:ribosomal protein L7/L12 [Nocardioides marmoribigeumensis]MDR7361578.1 ribosomal protein L7/L12 [Nocardioides marmoribigeumensis]